MDVCVSFFLSETSKCINCLNFQEGYMKVNFLKEPGALTLENHLEGFSPGERRVHLACQNST